MSNRLPKTQYNKLKREIAERDGNNCVLCGRPANDIHHIDFRSQGGKDEANNLVCLCRDCHMLAHGIGARTIRELLKKYIERRRRCG